MLALVPDGARGDKEPLSPLPPASESEPTSLTLVPPLMAHDWIASPERDVLTIDLRPKHEGGSAHARRLSLDLTASFLRIAVNGDNRRGLVPYLGTSLAAIGGFRLRF